MTNSDRTAFVCVMTRLGVAFNQTLTAEHFEVYFEALRDYELEFLEPAVAEIIRTSKWFPKPVELRDAASQMRVEARRTALGPAPRHALADKALTVDEVKAFLADLRAKPAYVAAPSTLADLPRKGVEALHDEARRLEAIGACDMSDEKAAALEHFRRYQTQPLTDSAGAEQA